MTRGKLTPRKAAPPADDDGDAVATALLISGIGLLVYAFAPPELRALIVETMNRGKRKAPAAVDLSKKYPGAIEVP